MYKEIELYFEIRPTPHQSVRKSTNKKTGMEFYHQPKKIEEFKEAIITVARKRLPAGFCPWKKDVPLVLYIHHYFQYRKSEKKGNIGKRIPKLSKPDVTDNLNKAFVDALAGIVFEQDQQIFGIVAFKYWYHKDAIHAKFKTL